eukprot:263438_1
MQNMSILQHNTNEQFHHSNNTQKKPVKCYPYKSSEADLKAAFYKVGYINVSKIADTLQGSLYKAEEKLTNEPIVIKITSKHLHKHSLAFVNNKYHPVNENILFEATILKHLTKQKDVPQSMIKYRRFFECNTNYYLIMEHGGCDLFSFVLKAHRLIATGHLNISEWHKAVKVIFKQMVECVEFIHSKNICHFDISLENCLINDVEVQLQHKNQDSILQFVLEDMQIKIIDFGLAEKFETSNNFLTSKICGKSEYKSPEIVKKCKQYSAQSNDIWCLGICLYMFIIGSRPWHKACLNDKLFKLIMNGEIIHVLKSWDKMEYVNNDLINLFELFFQYYNFNYNLNLLHF